ncbi:hypothetical protein FB451DRAFT_1551547 [Mycena latifolia]|nr:hypothetical protein FB451DRAFT_1551547 [Mycena latifolia]
MTSKIDEVTLRRTRVGANGDSSIYDACLLALDNLGTHGLATHDINFTFGREITSDPDNDKHFINYVNLNNHKTFSAYILAEVGSESEGTWMAAYPKKMPPSKLPLGDEASAHRMIIAAPCPTGAPTKMADTFKNCMAVIDEIHAEDQKKEEAEEKASVFQLTERASRSDGDEGEPFNIMLLRLAPTYEKSYRDKNKTAQDEEHQYGKHRKFPQQPKIGDTYDPNMLPDHRGPYFNHKISKLVQRNYQDLDGSLIAPHELYVKLTEGTLFSAQITLHTYISRGVLPIKFITFMLKN